MTYLSVIFQQFHLNDISYTTDWKLMKLGRAKLLQEFHSNKKHWLLFKLQDLSNKETLNSVAFPSKLLFRFYPFDHFSPILGGIYFS